MIHPWSVIYGVVIFWIAFGAILHPFLDKKTKYDGNTQGDHDNILIWWIFFGGIFSLFFIKIIKRQRKHKYLKNRIEYLKWCDHGFVGTGYKGNDNMCTHRIEKMERILKISMLHQQTRRNNIKKKLLLKWL